MQLCQASFYVTVLNVISPCGVQVSEELMHSVHDCFHLTDTLGSDHCPIGLVLMTTPEGSNET